MGVLEKFLDVMNLTDDEDYDEDYFDDDFEEEEEEYTSKRKAGRETSAKGPKTSKTNSKITPMRQSKRTFDMEVRVIKPSTVEDAREITETLLSNRTVILNLEGADVDVAQRVIDFASGSCYALNGNLQKISNFIFIVTPSNVDISGDFQEILTSAYDMSSIQTEF